MSYQLTEQVVHDRINLLRLVRRLEKSVDGEEWLEGTREPSRAAWIKTQGVMQVREQQIANQGAVLNCLAK